MYLYNDVYELPLHVMGSASSGLKGFDVENYDVMKTQVLFISFKPKQSDCAMAGDFGEELQDFINLRNGNLENICPATTKSCCKEEYYKALPQVWAKNGGHEKTQLMLFQEFLEAFTKWLLATNEKGEMLLKLKMEEVMKNPKCLASCRQKVNVLNIWGIRYAWQNQATRMKMVNAKCGNYLLSRKMAVPCLVCDSNFGFLYHGTLPGQHKRVRVSPEQCSHLMTQCFEWSAELSKFNKGVYFYAVWLAKFTSGQDFDVKKYIPAEINTWERTEHCNAQW